MQKDKRGIEISVARKNPMFQREEPESLEKDELRTKESDNDHFHKKREDETK